MKKKLASLQVEKSILTELLLPNWVNYILTLLEFKYPFLHMRWKCLTDGWHLTEGPSGCVNQYNYLF